MKQLLISISFFSFFLFVLPTTTHAALLYTELSGDVYGPGDTFIASVRLDNQEECINAGRIVLTYPKELIKAVDFSRGDSLFTLWVQNPELNNDTGEVMFEGGVPGGYCGRIQGDPSLSNVLGKVIFTVIGAGPAEASIGISESSELYIGDGLGSKAPLETRMSTLGILKKSTGAINPWLTEIDSDTIPPDSFAVRIESTKGVFGGNYYAVFSTVDKQSGLSHFEIFERGQWKRIQSPHQLRDQSLEGGVTIRAVDKAGNVRVGVYDPEAVPERQSAQQERLLFGLFVVLLVLGGAVTVLLDRRHTPKNQIST